MRKYQKMLLLLAMAVACFCLSNCAATEPVEACLTGQRYGFFYGLLHGFITPISFIGGLFDDQVAIYAVNNSGNWYDFGFLLGSSGWGFMAGNKSKR